MLMEIHFQDITKTQKKMGEEVTNSKLEQLTMEILKMINFKVKAS